MGKIDIRKIEEVDDESVSFQKIKKKKTTETNDQTRIAKPNKQRN
jgi:ribosomal protein L20A (L18A)